MRKRAILFLLSFVFFLALFPVPAQETNLQSLQQNILGKLGELNKQLYSMETQSKLLQQVSEKNQSEHKVLLQNLNNSYIATLEELNSCYNDINTLNTTLKVKDTKIKNLLSLSIVLIVLWIIHIALKVGAYILMVKKIPVPRWLDILV